MSIRYHGHAQGEIEDGLYGAIFIKYDNQPIYLTINSHNTSQATN